MPQNTTFFSRGETPTFVNYVIAHNKARPPAKGAFPIGSICPRQMASFCVGWYRGGNLFQKKNPSPKKDGFSPMAIDNLFKY